MSLTFTCAVAPLNPGVTAPVLRFGGASVESYFSAASNSQIDLRFDLSRAGKELQKAVKTQIYDLHDALDLIASNASAPATRVGLLFANEFPNHPKLLGAMFDLGFKGPAASFDRIPREGCVVFVDAARRERPSAPDDETVYTAIHELGHVFNLGHIENVLGFMTSSLANGSHLAVRDFVASHRTLLRLASADRFIQPGGSNYGVIGTHQGGGDYSIAFNTVATRAPFGLDFTISMNQREFWNFEPVELDLSLSVAPGVDATFVVPDTIDPGFANFDIWIEEPNGERRLYQSTKQLCAAPASTLTVRPESPFRRDLSIFGQRGGYTFRRSGVHRLSAMLDLPDGSRVQSNTLEVNILPTVDDTEFRAFRSRLTRKGVPEVLFYRPARITASLARSLTSFADKYESTPSGAGVRYAVGRSLHAKAVRIEDRAERRKVRTAAKNALLKVADHYSLNEHRRVIASTLAAE